LCFILSSIGVSTSKWVYVTAGDRDSFHFGFSPFKACAVMSLSTDAHELDGYACVFRNDMNNNVDEASDSSRSIKSCDSCPTPSPTVKSTGYCSSDDECGMGDCKGGYCCTTKGMSTGCMECHAGDGECNSCGLGYRLSYNYECVPNRRRLGDGEQAGTDKLAPAVSSIYKTIVSASLPGTRPALPREKTMNMYSMAMRHVRADGRNHTRRLGVSCDVERSPDGNACTECKCENGLHVFAHVLGVLCGSDNLEKSADKDDGGLIPFCAASGVATAMWALGSVCLLVGVIGLLAAYCKDKCCACCAATLSSVFMSLAFSFYVLVFLIWSIMMAGVLAVPNAAYGWGIFIQIPAIVFALTSAITSCNNLGCCGRCCGCCGCGDNKDDVVMVVPIQTQQNTPTSVVQVIR
jgi:hypothetical protein